jgi:hypothetical protein
VKFKKAVEDTPNLAGTWRDGLGALRGGDRAHINARDTRKLRGSVDIDSALRSAEPIANRWDFAIGFRHSNRNADFIYWVEIHPSSDNEIKVLIRKLEWLKGWLIGDGAKLAKFEREFVWVASGSTSFTKGATQVKALATKGLRYVAKTLLIPNDL